MNTGLKIEVRDGDWIAGEDTKLGAEVKIDFSKYLPDTEKQKLKYFDTMACVSFSLCNVLETWINYLVAIKDIDVQALKDLGVLKKVGKKWQANLSDRFLAKMSNTQKDGNYFQVVLDTFRKNGCVSESDWAVKDSMKWNDYYAEIPQDIKDKGKRLLDIIKVNYDWINVKDIFNATESLKDYSDGYLIQAGIPICPNRINSPAKTCGKTKSQHAVMIYKVGKTVSYFDTYPPFLLELEGNYPIPTAIRIIAKPATKIIVPVNPCQLGDKNTDVEILQTALKELGYFTAEVTGFYGPLTQKAVFAFQVANVKLSIYELNVLKGSKFGPKSIEALNNLFIV